MITHDGDIGQSVESADVYDLYDILDNAGDRIEEIMQQCGERGMYEKMLARIQSLCDEFLLEVEHEKEVLELMEMGTKTDIHQF